VSRHVVLVVIAVAAAEYCRHLSTIVMPSQAERSFD
jgi:hypothetical protein